MTTITLNDTVYEFLKKTEVEDCRRIDIVSPKRRVGHRFLKSHIDKIPEDLLQAKIKDAEISYDPMAMLYDVCLYIE